MPAFNVEHYVAESIQSVIDQSFEDWELIVTDDCSSDQTRDVVAGFVERDSRVSLLTTRANEGGAAARNLALSAARGRYVAFLDSDDLWDENKLSLQLKYMRDTGAVFTYTSYRVRRPSCERGPYLLSEPLPILGEVGYGLMKCNNFIGCLTVVLDRAVFSELSFPLIEKRHDFAFWLKLLREGHIAVGLNRCLATYTVRGQSLSRSKADAVRYYRQVLVEFGHCGRVSSYVYLILYMILSKSRSSIPGLYKVLLASLELLRRNRGRYQLP